jgi:hydroxyethylthiazole kinase-like uncharacterized protein yjeF
VVREAIPPEEVKVLDVNAAHLGLRTVTLMENAGRAVARNIVKVYPEGVRVAVVCGKGNNGGDGFVAARYLAERTSVGVFLAEPADQIESSLARANLQLVERLARPAEHMAPGDFDVVIDALLGVGLKGRPREPYAGLIKRLNASRRPVVSVDVPSGWPSDLQVLPKMTVTFHAPKVGMTSRNSGRIVVEDIGISQEAERYCGPGDFSLLPRRNREAHKGDGGRVLVIGGGPYTGAPAFAAMAAMAAGADLAFVETPEVSASAVSIYSPNKIVRPLPGEALSEEHVPGLLKSAKEVDVVAIGPGLGNTRRTVAAAQEFISRTKTPLVIDADAIEACGKKQAVLRGKQGVITPHAGEFKKLTGRTVPKDDEKKAALVRQAASKLKMTLLLKGATDVISDGRRVKMNRTGCEGMTVGGTGDVLTGLVAGFMAQKAAPFSAARIGAFTSGVAGQLAFEERSYGMLATDVIEKVPLVLRRYL